MEKLWKHEDFDRYSEIDTKAEWDKWQKKASKLWEHEILSTGSGKHKQKGAG